MYHTRLAFLGKEESKRLTRFSFSFLFFFLHCEAEITSRLRQFLWNYHNFLQAIVGELTTVAITLGPPAPSIIIMFNDKNLLKQLGNSERPCQVSVIAGPMSIP